MAGLPFDLARWPTSLPPSPNLPTVTALSTPYDFLLTTTTLLGRYYT